MISRNYLAVRQNSTGDKADDGPAWPTFNNNCWLHFAIVSDELWFSPINPFIAAVDGVGSW